MAEGSRIPYNPGTPMGAKLRVAALQLTQARSTLGELHRQIEAYAADNADLATDLGMDPGDVALFRNLLAQSTAELCDTALVQVAVGAETSSRQFGDAMG